MVTGRGPLAVHASVATRVLRFLGGFGAREHIFFVELCNERGVGVVLVHHRNRLLPVDQS